MTRQFAFFVVVAVVFVAVGGCAPVASSMRREHPLLGTEVGTQVSTPTSLPTIRPLVDEPVIDSAEDAQLRARVAAAAAGAVGDDPLVVGGVRYRFDCSGVAAGIYAKAGLRLAEDGAPSTRALYTLVEQKGSLHRDNPLPGDLVFFDDTWDQNGNGRRDDPLSHVGVVERVEPDGTVLFVHRIGRLIVRWRMNTARPHDRADEKGSILNHWLRAAEGSRASQTTAELFVAYGSLPPTALQPRSPSTSTSTATTFTATSTPAPSAPAAPPPATPR